MSDEDRRAGLAYGTAPAPDATYPSRMIFLIDPDGRIEKVYEQVTPATHPDEVLADLG